MLSILATLLNFLGGGVLDRVMTHLERQAAEQTGREKLKTDVTLSEIKAELDLRKQQAAYGRAALGHRVMWLPWLVIMLAAAVYFTAHVVDAVWQLQGDVAPLTPEMATLLKWVFGFMFLGATFRK